MRKEGRTGVRPLVVKRGFVRSRHEMDFAAVAYEYVVPIRKRELLPSWGGAREFDRRSVRFGTMVGGRA